MRRSNLIKLGALCLLFCGTAYAAGGGLPLDHANTNISSKASLQRGARLFVNYCLSCHSAKFMRYGRLAQDLGLTEDQVKDNLMMVPGKLGDVMTVAMREDEAIEWLGAAPPDLSVVARSRGVDWLYTFLRSYYADESRPSGWNNTVYENTSMPNVLWELQGIRNPVWETHTEESGLVTRTLTAWEQVTEGSLTEAEYDSAIRDLVTYMEYMGEPAKLQRASIGVWVLMFLALFTFLAYLLKVEYWRDVH